LTPHGTPPVGDLKIVFSCIVLLQLISQAFSESAGKRKIPLCRCVVYLNIPFLTATVGTISCNTAELIVITRFEKLHKCLL
jgi:hypothetical protein